MIRYDDTAKVAQLMNHYGAEQRPFVCLIDFEFRKMIVEPIDQLDETLKFSIGGSPTAITDESFRFNSKPVDYETYECAYKQVQNELKAGNSYLLNLSFGNEVLCNLDLHNIYSSANARYRVLLDKEFVSFSPECFVRIANNVISTFPMKGTIDASVPDAKQKLLNNKKEQAEHATIVDLLRNDLSRVANKVRVSDYRYCETIERNEGALIQISSRIDGALPSGWCASIGDILFELMPAGSISGAPKKKTVEIIQHVEPSDRGYYTGVFGYFDGSTFDSAVMIRYIEQSESGALYYRSGGGITAQSSCSEEYQELKDKIYVPISRNDPHQTGQSTIAKISPITF